MGWDDLIVRYFRTGSLPNNLMEGDQIAMTLPQKAGGRRFYRNAMENPQIHMKVDRTKAGDDIFNTSKLLLTKLFLIIILLVNSIIFIELDKLAILLNFSKWQSL